jgi:hypothetical protein
MFSLCFVFICNLMNNLIKKQFFHIMITIMFFLFNTIIIDLIDLQQFPTFWH